MPTYTVEQLRRDGPPYAMAMLLRCLRLGEPYVTYLGVCQQLEHQFGVEKIFPTQIGEVAGSMMDQILAIEPNAPLINVLIARDNGIPGKGAGSYFAARYGRPELVDWDTVPRAEKVALIEQERTKVIQFPRWDAINHQLFGMEAATRLLEPTFEEPDYLGSKYGGSAESMEHQRLKEWVAEDPTRIGLGLYFGVGEPEHKLLSGDEVDVMFHHQKQFRAIEVKSLLSTDDDLRRGLYQCVKYREVKKAEILPYTADVQAILVTERALPPTLRQRAKMLGVKHLCVKVNN